MGEAVNFSRRYAHIYARLIQRKLVRNPAYNNQHCELNNWCWIPVDKVRTIKPGLHAALEESVLREGFRNPIVVYALPSGLYLSFGGSRLYTAQRLNLMIPCLVVDYTGEFSLFDEVHGRNWAEFFTDVPVYFEFTDDGIDTHYSLERNRRNDYDAGGMAWAEHLAERDFVEREFPWLTE